MTKERLLNPLICHVQNIKLDISVRHAPITSDEDEIYAFGSSKNEDYDVENNQVEVLVSKCDNQEFDIIYQNITRWFKNIWQTKSEAIKNRIVSITIQQELCDSIWLESDARCSRLKIF